MRVEVEDNGCGISPDDIPKLFVPYFQIRGANKRVEGTGLGLSIAKQIVADHHGVLSVTAGAATGRVLWFEVPRTLPKLGVHSPQPLHPLQLQQQQQQEEAGEPQPPRPQQQQQAQPFGQQQTGEAATENMPEVTEATASISPSSSATSSYPTSSASITTASIATSAPPIDAAAAAVSAAAAALADATAALAALAAAAAATAAPSEAATVALAAALPPDLVRYGDRPMLRILIVDDVHANRYLLRKLLKSRFKLGDFAEACNGEEAVTACVNKSTGGCNFDVVLMDASMPVLDGYEATRQLRARFNSTQLLILGCTGNALMEE